MSVTIEIYTTQYCGFCVRAKQLLASKGLDYTEFSVDGDRAARQELAQRSGQHTVPQIWIGETHIGGCDDLFACERSGRLDALLGQSA